MTGPDSGRVLTGLGAREQRRRRRTLALMFFLGTSALWAACFTVDRFIVRDAYDYAQIGRQIREGDGYTTRQIFPRHIPYIEQKGYLEEDWPSLLRYPVSPTLNALAQLVITDPVKAAVVQTGAWFLLSVPLFFLLADRLTGLGLASVATVFYVGDPRIWRDSYNGMTESIAVLIVLAVFNLGSLPAAREGRRRTWVTLGLLAGLAYLTRTQLIVLVPLGLAWVAWAVRPSVRARSALLFLVSALVAISPWLVRNYLVTGDPLFAFTNSRNLLAHTATHTGIDRYLHEPVDVGTVLARYGDEIGAKIVRHIWPNVVDPRFWLEAIGLYSLVIPVFVLVLILGRRRLPTQPGFVAFERITLLLLLSNFFLVCLIYHRQRYYDTMIPLLIIVLVQRFGGLAGLIRPVAGRRWRQGFFLLVLALAGGRALATLSEHVESPGVAEVDRRSYAMLDELIDDESVVLSDLSAQVTLYNGNRTVRTPAHPEEILEIDAEYLAVDYVLLSQHFLRPSYAAFIESEEFRQRFELQARLPNDALLFRRGNFSQDEPVVATPLPQGPRYYAAQLHLHGSLSEDVGTMRGHNTVARNVGGIDILWWTDHDWRVARHTYATGFDFEVQAATRVVPHRNVPWKKPPRRVSYGWQKEDGGVGLAKSQVRLTEESASQGDRSLHLEVDALPDDSSWGWSGARLTAQGGRFQAALAAEIVLRLSVKRLQLGDDARAVVSLRLSRQPEGLAELRYVLGNAGKRRVERSKGRLVAVVPLELSRTDDWQEVVLPVTADALSLELGGWDNSLNSIAIMVQARRGASAAARFDDLRIEAGLSGVELLARQVEMAEGFEEQFGLVNHVGTELSYSFHMNAYLPRVELPNFVRYPSGMSGAEIVDWVHERGGVVSYNHIFGTAPSAVPGARQTQKERSRRVVVEGRAFGADLLEVGYPLRVEPLQAHLDVWDDLSAERVFLTGIGSSDSHDQEQGWFDGNNFITWIWAESSSAADLIAGLRSGRAFLGDPNRFRGTLDLETMSGHTMGRVVFTGEPRSEVRLRLTELPPATRVRWLVNGQEVRSSSPPGGSHQESLLVDTRSYRFVRVEVWVGERGLAFSNCLYFVPASEGKPPATHRLVDGRL